jgi:hypothetical protein
MLIDEVVINLTSGKGGNGVVRWLHEKGKEFETDFKKEGACATVLSCLKGSEFSTRLLNGILRSPIHGGTTCWGKDRRQSQ